MKTIIAGSRGITDISYIEQAVLQSEFEITEVVSGTCHGVDLLGEEYADNYGIKISRFPGEWEKHGRSAGMIRNTEMAQYADALIAVWDGVSKGTKHMINTAKGKGMRVFVLNIKE